MSDEKVKIQFDFEADPQAVGRIQKALDNIAKAQERVSKDFEKGNVGLKQATAIQQKLNADKQQFLAIQDQLNASANRANQEREEALQLERQITEESKEGLRAQQDKFDTISRDVSLAGDFQSNLGAVRGLSSAAGAGGVSQALDIGGETVALVEELPRLLAAAQGLPATIKASAAAMKLMSLEILSSLPSFGAFTAGLTGVRVSLFAFLAGLGPFALAALVAVAAITALIAIFSIFSKSSNDAKKASEEQIAAEELSTKAARERFRAVSDEQDKLEELIAIREENNQKTDDLTDRQEELGKETEALTTVLNNGTTAINDTKIAEQELADQRATVAAEAGEDAANQEALRQEIRDANSEELAQLTADLEDRKAVLEAERQALKDSGDESEETQQRLAELDDQLQDVDESLAQAGSSASQAVAAENTLSEERAKAAKEAVKLAEKEQKEREREQEKAEKKAKREREKLIKEAEKAQKKQVNEANKIAKKEFDIQEKADESLIALQDKFNKDTANAFTKAVRGEEQETRKADKSRKDLLKDLSRQEEDLIASGDIFAIQDIREEASENLADLREDFDFDANERKIQRRNEANDRLREARDQRTKLREAAIAQLQDLSQSSGAIRTGWRGMLTGLGNDLSSFTRAVSGRAGNVAGRTPGATALRSPSIRLSIDGAPIRAIAQQEIGATI